MEPNEPKLIFVNPQPITATHTRPARNEGEDANGERSYLSLYSTNELIEFRVIDGGKRKFNLASWLNVAA